MSRYEYRAPGEVLKLTKPRPGYPARREVVLSGISDAKAKAIVKILNQPDDGRLRSGLRSDP